MTAFPATDPTHALHCPWIYLIHMQKVGALSGRYETKQAHTRLEPHPT